MADNISKETTLEEIQGQPVDIKVANELWKCHTKEMEVRRLLSHLDHASVDERVCEETQADLTSILYPSLWKMSAKSSENVLDFLVLQKQKWANDGYFIIIEGGEREKDRRRVLNFVIYQAILARLKSYTYIARIYDWQSILNDLTQFNNPERRINIEGMSRIGVLGINEFDLLLAPRFNHDLNVVLTSILRKRILGKRPTIISLSKPSWEVITKANNSYGPYIEQLLQTANSEMDDKVIRIRLLGGISGWEKAE